MADDSAQIRMRLAAKTGAIGQPWLNDPVVDEQQAETAGQSVETWLNDPVAPGQGRNPDNLEKIEAFGKHAVGGLVEGAIGVGGMIAGAKTGAALMPIPHPYAKLAGGVVGGVAGLFGGNILGEAINPIEKPSQESETYPYEVAGEIFGASMGGGASIVGTGMLGVKSSYPFINRILENATSHPYAALQAGASSTSAIMGGVTASYGGSEGQIAAASIAGGAVNSIITSSAKFGIDKIKDFGTSLWNIFSGSDKATSSNLNKAAKIFQDAVRDGGDDPAMVAKILREKGLVPTKITSAQKSGAHGLANLEHALIKYSAQFGDEAQRSAKQGINDTVDMIAAMRGTGDPQMIKAAAQTEEHFFKSMIAARLVAAEDEATKAASVVVADTPGGREYISQQVTKLVEIARQEMRTKEKSLYDLVDQSKMLDTSKSVANYLEIQGQFEPGKGVSGEISAFFNKLIGGEKSTIVGKDGMLRVLEPVSEKATSGSLINIRSKLLDAARRSGAANDPAMARIYGELAESVLDDLDQLAGKTGEITPYDTARSFTRQLHNVFTRTFAGKATATTSTGARRIAPEAFLQKALGPSTQISDYRLKELYDAVDILPKLGIGGAEAEQNAIKMLNLQEEAIRLAAHKTIDPITGKVNPKAMASFLSVKGNAKVLERFPGVKKLLEEAMTSEVKARNIEKLAGVQTKTIDTRGAYAQLIRHASPSDAIKAELAGKEPVQALSRMARLAKRNGSETTEGFIASVFDNAFRNAGAPGGAKSANFSDLNMAKLYTELFEPLSPGQPSVMLALHKEGIIGKKAVDQAQALFAEAARIGKAISTKSTTDMNKAIGDTNLLYDAMVRLGGSETATLISKGAGMQTSSLIIGGVGSNVFRKFLEKIPKNKVMELIIKAAQEPEFGATLLEKATTLEAKEKLALKAHAYAIMAFPDLFMNDENGVVK